MSNDFSPLQSRSPPNTDFNPPVPSYWELRCSFRARSADEEVGRHDSRQPVINRSEVYEAYRQLRLADVSAADLYTLLIPKGFPRPHILLSAGLWSDLIDMGGYWLFSRRLREAMALPDAAAQFYPIDLETESEAVRAMDYQWLSRLNMQQGLVDPERSTCSWETVTRRSTGEEFSRIDELGELVTCASFQPNFDLFKPLEAPFLFCATDALQARVIAAGCVGVGFISFGTMALGRYWLSDEDGKRIIDPYGPPTELETPAAVLRERPDLRDRQGVR